MNPPGQSTPDPAITTKMREAALAIFDHAMAECSIPRAFARHLHFDGATLSIDGHSCELARFSRLALICIGKASHSMAEALTQIVPADWHGVVSCPVMPATPVSGLGYFVGGHPMPNDDSLRAGKAILSLLRSLPADALVLFCISGGASAIAEWPLDSTLTLSDIVAINRTLVHSGAPIAEINAIRKHLSAIKGGRMAEAASPASQVSLLVSDVPDNAIDALASGPTMPDASTVADCQAIARCYDMLPGFPPQVQSAFQSQDLRETPKAGNSVFAKSRFVTLLSNQTAVTAAVARATALGFSVTVDNSCDDWDYASAADYLLPRLRELRRESPQVCLISGGEVTVKVGAKSGVGGRNQQFALYCAERIGSDSIIVLSAGTDGIDGNSSAAGALVDGTSFAKAAGSGFDSSRALAEFNAFPLLDSIGDAIVIGPTGNNVRDLRILLAD
jgi:glycerate 2-kinase